MRIGHRKAIGQISELVNPVFRPSSKFGKKAGKPLPVMGKKVPEEGKDCPGMGK